MLARIYKAEKTATQSGPARAQGWILTFAPASARSPDPLMGWTQTSDTRGQIQLDFETREAAIDYAMRQGIPFELIPEAPKRKIIKAYADNFAFGRKQPWTH